MMQRHKLSYFCREADLKRQKHYNLVSFSFWILNQTDDFQVGDIQRRNRWMSDLGHGPAHSGRHHGFHGEFETKLSNWPTSHSQESLGDEYLENNCVDDPVKLCDFQLLENRIMKTVDSVYQVSSVTKSNSLLTCWSNFESCFKLMSSEKREGNH